VSEVVEVLDRRWKAIGRATRPAAHAKRLLHRSVHILLFDSLGRLFVQRRSLSKDLYPGKYAASASGHVRAGEPIRQAAARELSEELGLKGIRLTHIATLPSITPEERELCTYFRASLPKNASLRLNRKELIPEDSRFLSWKQAGAIAGRRRAPSLSIALRLHRQGRV